jgi:hypothetical protein
MRTRELECYDYSASENPPILHRKDTFLAADHPLYEKFARLTQPEERHGLLDETLTIGTRAGWEARLAESVFRLAGHRLMRRGGKFAGPGSADNAQRRRHPEPIERRATMRLRQRSPAAISAALSWTRWRAFMSNNRAVARPMEVRPLMRAPRNAKCSLQSSVRGLKIGTMSPVRGSTLARFVPL